MSAKDIAGEGQGQSGGKKGLKDFSPNAGGETQAGTVQYRRRLAQHGQPAPARAGGGQDEAENVRCYQRRQGKQLHSACQDGGQRTAPIRQGADEHVEQSDEGTDGQHPAGGGGDGGHQGGGKGYGPARDSPCRPLAGRGLAAPEQQVRTLPNTPLPRTLMRNTGLELLQKVKSRSASSFVKSPCRYSSAAERAPMG